MVPTLFHLGALQPSESTSISLATPAGTLLLTATLGAVSLTAHAATSFADATRSLRVWEFSGGHAELLVAPPQIVLPPGMAIDGALAALWRVRVEREYTITLDLAWAPDTSLTAEGPESGENLDAQAWANQHTRVVVGLPDNDSSTSYKSDGFQVVRTVAPADIHEIQCVCAWRQRAEDGLPLWYAVDRTTSDIVGDLAPVG